MTGSFFIWLQAFISVQIPHHPNLRDLTSQEEGLASTGLASQDGKGFKRGQL